MLSVLSSINRAQPVTLGALAALERVQPPTITATVGRLEEADLVSREIDPATGVSSGSASPLRGTS